MDNKQAALELGQKPVGQLLWQYALPAIVAMTASSLYNIIDRAMIGQIVGPEAIAGLGITFPFMNLSAAFGAAVGVGSSTCISVKLGQRDYDTAQHLLGNTVTLNLIIGFVFMAVCLLFLDPILLFFGASEATLPYAREFMVVILLGNMVTHMYFGMNAVLRAAGKPRHAMWATLFTVACNIVLVVMFVWWFRWGIRGAALATVTSQSLALCWQMWIFSDKKELLHLKRGIYRLKSQLVKNIVAIGISPFLMQTTSCVIVIFMNNQFVHYGGDMAVGAYSIANSVVMVFFMFVMGMNQACSPSWAITTAPRSTTACSAACGSPSPVPPRYCSWAGDCRWPSPVRSRGSSRPMRRCSRCRRAAYGSTCLCSSSSVRRRSSRISSSASAR